MESKAPFILILIGAILGIIGGIFHVFQWIAAKQFGGLLGNIAGIDISTLYTLGLILAIAHIVLALVFAIYSIKIAKNPTRTDFIIITILAAIGLLFAGMIFSGILILIGSIMGWVKSGKGGAQQPISVKPERNA